MPVVNRLTDNQVKNAKPINDDDELVDRVLGDGNGLQLRVRKTGSKLWNFNYRHPTTKKRINMGLGPYPDVKLATARKLTLEARELVAAGIDPKAHRNQQRLTEKTATENTVFKVATSWMDVKRDNVTSDYADDIWRSLENYIFPVFGDTPIADITAPQVIDLLKPIERKGNLETVKRLAQRFNEVMTHAVNSGFIHANPLAGIRAAFKSPKKQNFATIKPEELPQLMNCLANASIKKVTRALIEWQLHTMVRPAEAAGTRWAEIDMDKKIWTLPPERMKKAREHLVPLTDQTLALLEAIKPISGNREFVFPADRDPRSHCSNQTANMALKRNGYKGKLVSHGLRSLASTTLNEQGFEPLLIEKCLAHSIGNEVSQAYNRASYLEQRRELMQWWSEHIGQSSQGSLSVAGRTTEHTD